MTRPAPLPPLTDALIKAVGAGRVVDTRNPNLTDRLEHSLRAMRQELERTVRAELLREVIPYVECVCHEMDEYTCEGCEEFEQRGMGLRR